LIYKNIKDYIACYNVCAILLYFSKVCREWYNGWLRDIQK